MPQKLLLLIALYIQLPSYSQLQWLPVDSVNAILPNGLKLYTTTTPIDGKPNIAYYIEADLTNKNLQFDVDTTLNRRLTPAQFYQKNGQPLVVVNGTFFSFEKNQNLNVVIKDGRVLGHNLKYVTRKLADSTVKNIPIYRSALGITKKRKAAIAYIKTDSNSRWAYAKQSLDTFFAEVVGTDVDIEHLQLENVKQRKLFTNDTSFKKWKMQTAIGGGPVLLQNGQLHITNNEEHLFEGKAINDKHPRTAMGYTSHNKLIIVVVQGRFVGVAEGASLPQLGGILKDLGCTEALNLDGGGSSCMLVNGKPTITVSDKTGQRPVPAVFIIRTK